MDIDYRVFDQMSEICSWLEDNQSKIILKQRFLYSLTQDIEYIYDMLNLTGFSLSMLEGAYEKEIRDMYGDSLPEEDLLTALLKRRAEKIVIFGCGSEAGNLLRLLNFAGFSLLAFADNFKRGEYLGYPILRVEDIPGDAFVVISSQLHRDDMREQLREMGYEEGQIFYPGPNMLFCPYGTSYFDESIFKPMDEAVFIDGGCFHGETSKRFISWAKSYQKIIAFEPDAYNFAVAEKNLEGLANVMLWKAGMSDQNTKYSFSRSGIDGSGSRIMEGGQEEIEVKALDSVVKNRVSFIKLDIEGSELSALKGASAIIRRDRPRLAVCLYHKPEDIWEIPSFVKNLVPEYHMAVRHYMTNMYDTILYCWV